MDRDHRRDDRGSRDDREHKPRYERDRSRSPPYRERRDDRRRERSPFRGGSRGRGRGGGPPHRSDRDYINRGRDRQGSHTPPPPSHGRGGPQAFDSRPNGAEPRGGAQHAKHERPAAPQVKVELLDGEDEEAMMARIMGFKGFRSTKNTKVPGNDKNYAVNKVKKVEYRQYMNRVGGFNRPLSPTRTSA